jgi:hypothetical protein
MPQFLKYSPHPIFWVLLHVVTYILGQSGNIRFTVEQYWLIIKINRRNYLNIGGNMLYHSREWRKNIKVIINYNSSSRHVTSRPPPPPPPPTPVDNNFGKCAQKICFEKSDTNNFGKCARKICFEKSGTMGKRRANFFPPP